MEANVQVMAIEEMEPIFGGIARRARAELGVTAWGMQVMTLPPEWDGYPNHAHGPEVGDANQEEVYVPLRGGATLEAGGERFELRPGVMARVGPTQLRRIVPGPEGITFLALGGVPGSFTPSAWTELGGPLPGPAELTVPRALLRAAQGGDERAFVELTAPFRDGLHRHCYRLLGSLQDADDAVQETMLRAWQSIDRFQPRAPLRSWLYRIATNVSLRLIERRGRGGAYAMAQLEPYTDWERFVSPEPGPDAVVESREALGLAFVAAMQLLPARQRVVLVLRDVLDWPASEVADLLDDSVASVNSALHRARRAVARARAEERPLGPWHEPADEAAVEEVLRRFVRAWEAVDVPALVALLRDDAVLTMPPEDVRIVGAEQVAGFFATVPLDGRLDRIPLRMATANGQPALAAYADADGDGVAHPYGLMVVAVAGSRIAAIVGFPQRPDLFARLGLPATVERR